MKDFQPITTGIVSTGDSIPEILEINGKKYCLMKEERPRPKPDEPKKSDDWFPFIPFVC